MGEENTGQPEKPSGKAKVIVYSTPTCPYCKMAKQYFDENNVAYEDVDVSEDESKAEEMIKKSGQMGVPVIDVGGQIIVGFDKEELANVLGLS